jgi:citrate lyase beta subunit
MPQTMEKPAKIETTLTPQTSRGIFAQLKKANAFLAAAYPGESANRQPVHTVYGGAQLFAPDTARKLGELALKSLKAYAPEAEEFGLALGLRGSEQFARTVYTRVVEKLKSEPVEDYRIDFEDGYGNRPDDQEDYHAALAGENLARAMELKILPPFTGIRIKSMSQELSARGLRTMDIVITTLARRTKGRLPDHFVVTVPKVSAPEHVWAVAKALALLEARLKLKKNTLKLEIMVETPQSIFNSRGEVHLRQLVAAGQGRCVAAHFGTYDYTASCGITAALQHMRHPACDFAKDVMQISLAQTGVWLSDGATNIMPAPPHHAAAGGGPLTRGQLEENRNAVHHGWKVHYDDIRHSLETAYYQGWDLHPAQLPTRYAAVYSFFLESLEPASRRLKNFIEKAAQATLVGDVFDDAATGQGLLNYFLRGLNCGAITMEEASRTGLTLEEFQSRSFLKILDSRRRKL